MADAPKAVRISDCEDLIRQIRDVISVNIATGENSTEIEEIHVLAEDTRSAKQIARDIETLFRVEFDLDLDHKKISIVQLRKEQNNLQSKRLKFAAIEHSLRQNSLEVTVELSSLKKNSQGKSSGVNIGSNRLRLVAKATLQAVNSFMPELCAIDLDDMKIVNMSNNRLVVVSVIFIQGSQEEYLVGSAQIRQDEKEAVVRAILCALNRRIPLDF